MELSIGLSFNWVTSFAFLWLWLLNARIFKRRNPREKKALPFNSFPSRMAALLSSSFATNTPLFKFPYHCVIFHPTYNRKIFRIYCNRENTPNNLSSSQESEPQNALLKIAWYGSELLGIAASFLRSPSNVEPRENDIKLAIDGSKFVDREIVVETIKRDFERSYFVTGLQKSHLLIFFKLLPF